MKCPICGEDNNDNWVAVKDKKMVTGVCQMCWEEYCSVKWWEMIDVIGHIVN